MVELPVSLPLINDTGYPCLFHTSTEREKGRKFFENEITPTGMRDTCVAHKFSAQKFILKGYPKH